MALRDSFQPFQEAAVVDREQMNDVRTRRAVLERLQKFVQQIVGRTAPPRRGPVEVHADRQPVVHAPFDDTFLGLVLADSDALCKMLKQRRFAVAGIPAQNDEPDRSIHNVAVHRLFDIRFHVGLRGEIRVEPARLPVPPRRTGIGLQQGPEPCDLVRAPFRSHAGIAS